MRRSAQAWSPAVAVLALAATATLVRADIDWPMSLKRFGGGYPAPGDRCSRVGESAATAEFLDDAAILVACPASRSSVFVRRFLDTNGGRVVAEIEGFALISIPAARDGKTPRGSDIADSKLRCTVHTAKRLAPCAYDIVRKSSGGVIVKVTKPDGKSRTIYFANGRVTGADLKGEGKAKISVIGIRELDTFVVSVGEERYEIPANIVAGD